MTEKKAKINMVSQFNLLKDKRTKKEVRIQDRGPIDVKAARKEIAEKMKPFRRG